ncbi:MAG: nucleotidyltransferase family protein [Ardenticatenaceae bacterium]|nr:nucleotidyltransferase family protein [Anaerolineales bacterium]MCB9007321.1 nucleotidyltransferase family protein [Ardenticatenaceae bacterium]
MAELKQTSLANFSEQIRNFLPELRQQYGIKDLWLFGSYVRAEQNEISDLDVLVSFENPNLSLIEFIQLEQKLGDLLGVRVDLVEKETLKPGIGQRVLQEAQPV